MQSSSEEEFCKVLKQDGFEEEEVETAVQTSRGNPQEMNIWEQKDLLYVKGKNANEFIEFGKDGHPNYGSIFNSLLVRFHTTYSIISNGEFIWFFPYIICSILGNLSSSFFFVFHLFDIVTRNIELRNVVRAVTINKTQLTLTSVFIMIIIYI